VITPDARIDRLLADHPGLVEVLAGVHPHFERLRNPLLRRIMGPRLTVTEAAAMAGMPADTLLQLLRRAVGEDAAACPAHDRTGPTAAAGEPRPAALDGVRVVEVDVRDDIRRGLEPFARIMGAVKALGADEALRLLAPFEPVPLYDVLHKRGLAHWTEPLGPGDWAIWFYRAPTGGGRATADAGARGAPGLEVLDVRGLEPPQPMLRVLERLDALGPGQEVIVVHDRRPMFLYPQLEDRGFVHETTEVEPGRVEIRVRHGKAR
jgi:uncharacterized protein (DUF2249 family)